MIKPILFSTPMVRAILDGRKTMTRRIVNAPVLKRVNAPDRIKKHLDGTYQFLWDGPNTIGSFFVASKYQPGDILWVRETWAIDECEKCMAGIPSLGGECTCQYIYRADWPDHPRWRPSIFMPKSAARIWLRVTDVRVERVQDITNNDAIKEGCAGAECDCLRIGRSWMGCESCMNTGWQEPPVVEFMQLWDDLNAKRGYSWDSNLWVWVISFERCDKPQEVLDAD